ncbi:MAG TPA: EF-P beta-lysylation protein EpmB [Gammaproteobacteria bacterium]|nr:EF-P beta-lysylation protein EpmB [Gammaproteobacteria bacterium]
MIKASLAAVPRPDWRRELAQAIRDPAELAAILKLDPAALPAMKAASAGFRLLVPRGFAALMRRGDPDDPLLKQVLPDAAELAAQPEHYGADPLAESDAVLAPGLLHKYRGRALLVTTGACAVHCRYCFRRHFPYPAENPRRKDWSAALAAIAADDSLNEIILSGGDPLMLADDELAELAASLARIAHLRRLRIHTRLPVVLPARVDEALIAWLGASALPVTMVLHINHAREIGSELAAACARLRPHLRFLLNQSVLLAGVNDDEESLAELSRRLDEVGVLPYYLHLPDATAGTAHFAIGAERGRDLIAALRARLPGYLVPRLAREEPGAPAKRILA